MPRSNGRPEVPRNLKTHSRPAPAGRAPETPRLSHNPRTRAFFAPCPRGLEALLAAEITACGASDVKPAAAGVAFRGEMEVCWRVNLE